MKGRTRTSVGNKNLREGGEDLMTERDAPAVKIVRILSYLYLPRARFFPLRKMPGEFLGQDGIINP
jgi:hypothetical protein